ncbi:hypothetical protein OAL14_05795, partial [Gammaproteobacteria bacterium]|nr:hypothetical protein [Gammaproteobacteria bacterium]
IIPPLVVADNTARKLSDQKIEEEAKVVAKEKEIPVSEAVKEIILETEEKPYEILLEESPGAPFYRPEPYGGQTRLWINTAHRFYTNVYNMFGTGSTRAKAAIDLLLFTLAEKELAATEDRERFYQSERGQWSSHLENRLAQLEGLLPIEDLNLDEDGNTQNE